MTQHFLLTVGSTSNIIHVWAWKMALPIMPLTGLAWNTAGLTCHYILPGGADTGLLLAPAVIGTWTGAGFAEVSAVNLPGLYEFGVPDFIALSPARRATIMFQGAANLVPLVVNIDLVVPSRAAGDHLIKP